jgi:hypothetical protein
MFIKVYEKSFKRKETFSSILMYLFLDRKKMVCRRGLLYINLQKKRRKTTNAAVINDDDDDD